MRPDDLHSYIRLLAQADQLRSVKALVDPHLEVATIIDRVSKGACQGRALLFEQVKHSTLSVAANLFGSSQRVAWALGTTELSSLADKIAKDLKEFGQMSADQAIAKLCSFQRFQPYVTASDTLFDMTVAGLSGLPILKFWPKDGGSYITLGQVVTADPEGQENCGMYRMQVLDQQRLALHCRPNSGAASHLARWSQIDKPMPVAIALGGPPVLTWAAGIPLPHGVEEAAFAGYLSELPLALCRCQHSDLRVPATAEILIEGEVQAGDMAVEGPFGNHTGNYADSTQSPTIHVRRIARRTDAIYPTTMVGPPPMEDLHLAEAVLRVLFPLLRHDYPWVSKISMPLEGIYHRGAVLAIDPSANVSLSDVIQMREGSRLLRGARMMILYDDDVELNSAAELYWRLINAADWQGTVRVESGCLFMDARRPQSRSALKLDHTCLAKVLRRWHEYGLDS